MCLVGSSCSWKQSQDCVFVLSKVPDTDDVPVSEGGPVHLLLPLVPHLHLVIPHLAPEAGL